MPWKPLIPGEFPSLGDIVLDWIEEYLAAPDRTEYEPLILTDEQQRFVQHFYRLDPVTGDRRYRRAVWSRPKGHGKSPLLAAIGAAEALAPVVPAGWDADGRPVGKPWAEVRTPWVQFAAVSEDQTRNSWGPLLEMLREGSLTDDYPGVEPLETFVNLPKGRIEFVTSSAVSREGNRPVFCVCDQTETWVPGNSGVKLAAVLRRNLGKVGGSSIESPNAFVPGEKSVAEASAKFHEQIRLGKAKETGLLYDHREAPPDTDPTDRESLYKGLLYVYGDSAKDNGGWVDLDRIIAEMWDLDTDPQDARRYYMNQVTHASDAWLSQPDLRAIQDPDKVITASEPVTLGFDGSEGRKDPRSIADATVLIGYSVSQKHLFKVGVWEQPPGARESAEPWRPPVLEVEAAVRDAFKKFNVIGFYADPSAGWAGQVKSWEAAYNAKLKVKMTRDEPIRWRQKDLTRTCETFAQLESAILAKDVTYDASEELTRHFLNARRDPRRAGYVLRKPTDDQDHSKIDAAWGAAFAFAGGIDAAGVSLNRKTAVFKRLR